jgi:hypothetical protein
MPPTLHPRLSRKFPPADAFDQLKTVSYPEVDSAGEETRLGLTLITLPPEWKYRYRVIVVVNATAMSPKVLKWYLNDVASLFVSFCFAFIGINQRMQVLMSTKT